MKPVLPDTLLGGSAPRLRLLELDRIPFPGLPILLSSATQLVHLRLYYIPHPGHISPEVMATFISTCSHPLLFSTKTSGTNNVSVASQLIMPLRARRLVPAERDVEHHHSTASSPDRHSSPSPTIIASERTDETKPLQMAIDRISNSNTACTVQHREMLYL